MQEFVEAIQSGDYAGAYAALGKTDQANTAVGAASGAFLLALTGRYDEADAMLRGAGAPAIELIVRGERARMKRWSDPAAAGELSASNPLPFLGVYAGMAVAILQRDTELVERIKRDMEQIRPVGGRVRFTDGQEREFSSIVDADDAIGQMLETYAGNGLLYIPLASLRRIDFIRPANFIDLLIPKAQIVDAQGQTSVVLVPLLYAGSALSDDATVRAGRLTTFDYVGAARRAIGQRDFVLDGGAMVGMQRIASIELLGS